MAAGSNSLNLIVDANSPIFQYGPLPWTSSEFVQYYGSTTMTPDFSVGINNLNDSTFHAPYATFSLSFEGSAIAFIGNTPIPTSTRTFVVTIDGGIPYETSYDDTTPQSYTQWYQSPTLEEGTHTVKVDGLEGTSLDYAVITVGPSTPLAGTQVIVDNEDPAIQWSSGWKFDAAQFDSGFLPDGFAYQNSTRHSSAAGDLMTFRFQGTSVSIYGILSYFEVGMVSATFTLDGESTPQTYIVTEDDLASNQGDLPNFLFITYSNLLPQDHTLTINITRCINQAFMLDYITYTPSFYNLALMDNLSLPLDSPASSLSLLFPSPSESSRSDSSSSTAGTAPKSKQIPICAIVTVAIVLVVFIIALLWTRTRRRTPNVSIEEMKEEPTPGIFPFHTMPTQNQSALKERHHTCSPSGNVEMTTLPNYRQLNLQNPEPMYSLSADRKQQGMHDHWSSRRNVESIFTNEMTNMASSSRPLPLVPLRRLSSSSLNGAPKRRGTPSMPPPAYSMTRPRT